MDIITYMLLSKKIKEMSTISPFSNKGTVPTYEDLPSTAEVNDFYTTEDTGKVYVWDGTKWTYTVIGSSVYN